MTFSSELEAKFAKLLESYPPGRTRSAVIPMLLSESQSLCDANYVNNAAVKTPDDDLLFLVYPAGNSGFIVYADAGGTVIAASSSARRLHLQVLGNMPALVKRDGTALPQFDSSPEFDVVKFQHSGGNTNIDIH